MRAFLGPKYREIHDQSLDITCMGSSSIMNKLKIKIKDKEALFNIAFLTDSISS